MNTKYRGIYTDGKTMYVSTHTSITGKIFAINMNTKLLEPSKNINNIIIRQGNVNVDNGFDLHSDGTTMWVAVQPHRRIYAYTMSTGVRDPSKELATVYPQGIWGNGTTMWVTGINGKINAYNMNTGAGDPSKEIIINAGSGDAQPFSAWSDGTTIYTSIPKAGVYGGNAYFNRKVAAYNLATKTADTGKDISNYNDPLTTRSITSYGTTLYIY